MELTKQDYELIEEAKHTADRLHLDGIHEVAAALRTNSGQIFTGIHIETDVGNVGICGEVAALCCMVSGGHRDIETIVAVTSDGRGKYKLLVPCGRCREIISDFTLDAFAIVGTLERPYKMKISELLPLKPY
jgi:cytidine deaminase